MEITTKFEIGDTFKVMVTGFTGVVMAMSYYLSGCIHYGLQSRELTNDGQILDWIWFDESRLTHVKKKRVKFSLKPYSTSGNFPNPPQNL